MRCLDGEPDGLPVSNILGALRGGCVDRGLSQLLDWLGPVTGLKSSIDRLLNGEEAPDEEGSSVVLPKLGWLRALFSWISHDPSQKYWADNRKSGYACAPANSRNRSKNTWYWDLPSADPLGLSALVALRNSRLAFDLLLTAGQAGLS